LVGAAPPARVQGRLVRPHRDRHRPLVPVERDLLGVRGDHRETAAERARVDLPRLRGTPRPRRERGPNDSGRRAGGFCLRRWCETAPRPAQGGNRC
jgi:hypothetical protein